MKVKVLKSFVHEGWFMEQSLTVDIDDKAAEKYEKDGLVKIVKDKSQKSNKKAE